jgi:asparagine synthase (glutamine-hydrolysing)
MCGIAGILAFDERRRPTRELLSAMAARIAHRGPDGERVWLNHDDAAPQRPCVGLAFRRLAILDCDDRAMQPMHSPDGRFSITFNGEIYNFRELRAELDRAGLGWGWRTTGDSEVVLAAYAAWGPACVEKLNGMFALAVWDAREQSLFLARDRTGQKPLYYAARPMASVDADGNADSDAAPPLESFAYASELGALMTLDWVDRAVPPERIQDYLRFGYLGPSQTVYAQVHQLEPGGAMRVTRSGAVALPAKSQPLDYGPDAPPERARHTRQLVEQAVARQLVSDVPLGCFLSGGVDSSIISLCAQLALKRSGGGPLKTFSIGFDDPRYDETAYAAEVAKHLGTEHRQFVVKPNAAEDLPKLARVYGEPFGDSSALPTHYLSRETRAHVTVALSGDGGDELFGGYDRYRAMRLAQQLARVPRAVRRLMAAATRVVPGTHPKSRGQRLKRFAAALATSPVERYLDYVQIFPEPLVQELTGGLRPDFGLLKLKRTLREIFFVGPDDVLAAVAFDQAQYLPGDLHTKVDRASMLHGLEVRAPFMDSDLLNFAATLRTPDLLAGGPKRLPREAFAADLPASVFGRRKMGFAVPIGEWFRRDLRPMLHDHLFAADAFCASHLHVPTIRRIADEHEAGRADHTQRLYALLMLELWWRERVR